MFGGRLQTADSKQIPLVAALSMSTVSYGRYGFVYGDQKCMTCSRLAIGNVTSHALYLATDLYCLCCIYDASCLPVANVKYVYVYTFLNYD